MKITQFNNSTLALMRQEIQIALNSIAQKHGLNSGELSPSISYTPSSFTAKITFRAVAKTADPIEQAKQKYALMRLGLPDNSIGREFVSGGRTFKIDRIDSKKYKLPVIAFEVVNGTVTTRGFKFATSIVKKHLETQGA